MAGNPPAADLRALSRSLGGAGEVCPLEPGDPRADIDGVTASVLARPTSLAALSAVLREATSQGLVTVARGAGTASDWGAPPERADVILDVTGLDRIIEHEAGDLVVVAEAGLAVKTLQSRLGSAGQELVADLPPERLGSGSTVGGMLATAPSGPRRLQRLALRDLVLGATVVLADGTVAASGGKVVKNVAGYDLAKLMTGSFGTLGVIAQAAFRLHPVPPARALVLRTAPVTQAADLARRMVASRLALAAVEIDRPEGSDEATVAVLLEGADEAVATRAAEAAAVIGGDVSAVPSWWAALPGGAALAKATASLTGVSGLLQAARDAEQLSGARLTVRGSAGGVLYAGIDGSTPEAIATAVTRLRQSAPTPREGTVTLLRAPAEVRSLVDAWGPVAGLDLMRAIKDRLDPGRNLAPGRFVGGI